MSRQDSTARAKNLLLSTVLAVVTSILCLGAAELILRLKNSSMQSYDIEMWRYARELKAVSANPVLGHEHVPSRSAVLQSVEVRINRHGLRGPDVGPRADGVRRVLVLGSSVTLGWGVPEEDVMTSRLQRMFEEAGEEVEVLNGGIGNYNTKRYVERFLTKLTDLEPTDVVVHYFVNDAEELEAGGGNVLLRHSQLAVTLWIALSRLLVESGERSLVEHYRRVYSPDSKGYAEMVSSLERLSSYARDESINLYLAMTPDVHNLRDYQLHFIHERMSDLAERLGFQYLDLYPALKDLRPTQLWAMPGDPHPNAIGHQEMAEALFDVLRKDPFAQALEPTL